MLNMGYIICHAEMKKRLLAAMLVQFFTEKHTGSLGYQQQETLQDTIKSEAIHHWQTSKSEHGMYHALNAMLSKQPRNKR